MDYLLPPLCLLCGQLANSSHALCLKCQQELPILPHCCEQCAQFLPFAAAKCGLCLQQPPLFSRTFALFPYESPIDKWITQLKFHHQLLYASVFGNWMKEQIEKHWYRNQALPDLIIPIPLHRERLCARGFNQALEIARPISRHLKIPIDYQSVTRHKATLAQSGLTAAERKLNITNAFTSSTNYQGLKIALLDDVITTAATVRECAKKLQENGAAHIDLWCVARNGNRQENTVAESDQTR